MEIKPKVPRTNESDSPQTVFSIDDLLIAIFLRLPIKTLNQLKLVSKQWHRVIFNPRFSIQRNPIPNPAAGIFLQCLHYVARIRIEYVPFTGLESAKPTLRKPKFVKCPPGVKILHSCNGLLLCSSYRTSHHNRKYYVHNPTTNKFVLLPKLDSAGICGMSLAFDPINSPHYKVICVRSQSSITGWQLEVYSSETGSWRNHGPTPQVQVIFENGVYWNGAIHWTSNGTGNDSLYFNVDNQLFGIMPIPPTGWEWGVNYYYFGESCGHLHYMNVMGSLQFKVYEMRRDYSEWFVKYEVDLSPLVMAYPSIEQRGLCPIMSPVGFSVLCLVRGEKEEGSFLVVQIAGKAIRYNLVCQTFEMLREITGVDSSGHLRRLAGGKCVIGTVENHLLLLAARGVIASLILGCCGSLERGEGRTWNGRLTAARGEMLKADSWGRNDGRRAASAIILISSPPPSSIILSLSFDNCCRDNPSPHHHRPSHQRISTPSSSFSITTCKSCRAVISPPRRDQSSTTPRQSNASTSGESRAALHPRATEHRRVPPPAAVVASLAAVHIPQIGTWPSYCPLDPHPHSRSPSPSRHHRRARCCFVFSIVNQSGESRLLLR
ncbi:F-box protein [Striga hermonthica]|uniref:F-box protein n=1 Tax=Striga hermonthica TaxID=68872 RepID=A0A9N7NID8_STRHE|nr:F-box protein [Striga hermonthica]